jgi:hypothetical protein
MVGVKGLFVAGLAVFLCAIAAQAEEGAREELSQAVGTTAFAISYAEGSVAGEPSASISFDKDIVVNGNGLSAGIYELGLHPVADDDVHVVFSQRVAGGEDGGVKIKERLRLAVRIDEAPEIDRLQIDIELIEKKSEEDGERRRRRRRGPSEPSATMRMHWGGQSAALTLQMTGVHWVGTPPPEIPEHLQEPWSLALDSMNGLVEENMELHVKHFADNFESDWDDGGSEEAHVQFIGRALHEGGFEGSVLKLDKMEWTEAEGSVKFINAIVQAPATAAPLVYTVAKTDVGWKIIHLDGPKEE